MAQKTNTQTISPSTIDPEVAAIAGEDAVNEAEGFVHGIGLSDAENDARLLAANAAKQAGQDALEDEKLARDEQKAQQDSVQAEADARQ